MEEEIKTKKNVNITFSISYDLEFHLFIDEEVPVENVNMTFIGTFKKENIKFILFLKPFIKNRHVRKFIWLF